MSSLGLKALGIIILFLSQNTSFTSIKTESEIWQNSLYTITLYQEEFSGLISTILLVSFVLHSTLSEVVIFRIVDSPKKTEELVAQAESEIGYS